MTGTSGDAWNPLEWRAATWEEQLGQRTWRFRERVELGSGISPLTLYQFLRAIVGVPNGVEMSARAADSDNPIQWSFGVNIGGSFAARFIGLNDRTECIFAGREALPEDLWEMVQRRIKESLPKIGTQLSQVKKNMERWTIASNAFKRTNLVLEDVERRLHATRVAPAPMLPRVTTRTALEAHAHHHAAWLEDVRRAFVDASTARMLAPVLSESFLNLALLCLAKEELRGNRGAVEQFVRQDIHERVEQMHTVCLGFVRAIDRNDPRVKAFFQATQRRNDLLHGNVDPTRLMYEDVFFDFDTIPLFRDEQRLVQRLLGHLASESSPEVALAEISLARNFIEAVLGALDDSHREVVKDVMVLTHVGWRSETLSIGRLFPSSVKEMHVDETGTPVLVDLPVIFSTDMRSS